MVGEPLVGGGRSELLQIEQEIHAGVELGSVSQLNTARQRKIDGSASVVRRSGLEPALRYSATAANAAACSAASCWRSHIAA